MRPNHFKHTTHTTSKTQNTLPALCNTEGVGGHHPEIFKEIIQSLEYKDLGETVLFLVPLISVKVGACIWPKPPEIQDVISTIGQ